MKKVYLKEGLELEASDGSIWLIEKGDYLLEDDTTNIKVKNPGLLELPEGGFEDWSVDKLVNHFAKLAGTSKRQEIAKGVNNILRWDENKNPSLSKKAKTVMDKLSKKWEE